jgi:hypothetical protein
LKTDQQGAIADSGDAWFACARNDANREMDHVLTLTTKAFAFTMATKGLRRSGPGYRPLCRTIANARRRPSRSERVPALAHHSR